MSLEDVIDSRFEADTYTLENEVGKLYDQVSNASDLIIREGVDFSVLFRAFSRSVPQEEIANFIAANTSVLDMLKTSISEKLPLIIKYEILKSMIQTKEFATAPFYNFISGVSEVAFSHMFGLDITPSKRDPLKLNIRLRPHLSVTNILRYKSAVIATKAKLGIGHLEGYRATLAWAKYYDSAFGLRKIYRKGRKKKGKRRRSVDVTAEYAKKYWNTINTRISFLENSTIPFFDILNQGTNIEALSTVHGTAYPSYQGTGLIANIRNSAIELANAIYKDLINKTYSVMELEFENGKLIDEDALVEKITEYIVTGRSLTEQQKLYLELLSIPKYQKFLVDYFRENYHIIVKTVHYTKTNSGNITFILRDEKGRFMRWRIYE